MSAIRRKLKNKKAPDGWELIEEVIEDFELQMKEAVNEEHDKKRKSELTWKIHRLHWEKNRFIYDLMYQRKVMSRELFDWLSREKIADAAIISKWRKPGYEILCSMLAIQKGNHNFGTTSHCRVPMHKRASQQRISPDVQSGCISCASGDGRFGGPVWWNTPLEEDGSKPEENRSTWGQAGSADAAGAGSSREAAGASGSGGGGGSRASGPSGGGGGDGGASRKRPAQDDDDEDDMPEAVRQRLAALKDGNRTVD